MKLQRIDTYVVKTPPGHTGGLYFFFIRLTTDDGVEGWGETAILSSLTDIYRSYDGIMRDIFDAFLKGKSPMDREMIAKSLYIRLGSMRPGFLSGGIISAIDTALWDIAGKYCNRPIYDLLGGKMRDRLRSYTYIYEEKDRKPDYAAWGQERKYNIGVWMDPESAAIAAEQLAAEGFTAIKLDPITMCKPFGIPPAPWELTLEDMRTADKTLACIRKEVGDSVDIIIGTHAQLNTAGAKAFAKVLEQYNCMWFEEPVPCENKEEMAKVADSTWIPIASGERMTGIHEFNDAFRAGSFKIAQPDLGACGGITEAKKIATLAEPYYAQMAPHVWGGPIIHLAAFQLDTVIPNFIIQECIYKAGGFFSELLDEPVRWENGFVYPSDRPGLGHNLVEKQLKKYLA
ncbi:mandelate racemase/muconate lactonizing enzyme family protein [Desulfovibrio sp. OttesenSCG-928-O18]|nr:mandelate racemase/muconate lactonizing enzyme family protein [Desulfovibrio sp. OttesenSCG-928-O18]